jgi:hypothetical protein
MPKHREQRWAEWKGSQPQHTELRRAENDPNQPPLLPLFAGSLSAQLAFYGRNQLSSRRRICRDTARAAALRLSKKKRGLFHKTPKARGGVTPGRIQTPGRTRPLARQGLLFLWFSC